MNRNWTSRRTVLLALAGVCVVLFAGGMAAAWHNRDHTLCKDGKPPVSQRSDMLGTVDYKCHDGSVITVSD
ncbi:MAG TPA: hypothetical protein VHV52_03885 [Gaiellaceae bacterium]|nr:hypothetical protein [Gaiellaceae bacterium]